MLGGHESKVTVGRGGLLATVIKNRAIHEAEFTEAWAGFQRSILDEATKIVESAKVSTKDLDRKPVIALVEPKSHLKAYDRAIRMLEMSCDEQLTITEERFQELVLDEWDWSHAFKSVSATYSGRR